LSQPLLLPLLKIANRRKAVEDPNAPDYIIVIS